MADIMGFDEQKALFKDTLRSAFKGRNAEKLQTEFDKSSFNDTDKKAAMDQAFRELLVDLLSGGLDNIEAFVCYCIECCRRQMATATMPVILLGDTFDALTLDKCEEMFAYVENGVSIWKEELFFMACKNNLLRMCNDLLRKLSRSQNTVFCGRILLFLAKFFPFSERSGLNIVSEFNLENLTEYGAESAGTLKDSLEEESVVGEDKNKVSIDYNLYCKFWALQDFFRNPNTCYNKLQWKAFMAHSSSVLSAFGSYKLEAVRLNKSKLSRLATLAMDVDQEGKEQHYFAKFLTNQKLLELQLSDSNFRRCVLVQFLILFQYLNSTVKFKLESQELRSDQAEWVRETTALVYRLLGDTPPDGKQFATCVKHILRREEHWNTWKNDGCPAFQKPKPPVQAESGEETKKVTRKRRRPLGDIIEDYDKQGKAYLGNNDLTRLWNLCPDNLAACRTKDRDFMPNLDWYLLNTSSTADGRRRTGEGAWGWRALRLLARRSPHFFTHSNTPIGRLPEYLDDMVRRVAQVAPSSTAGTSEDVSSAVDNKKEQAESQEEEVSEEQMEADLIKAGDANDIEQAPDSTQAGEEEMEPENARSRVTMITPEQAEAVSVKLQTDWKKLAAKLGYTADEIEFFESESPTDYARAKKMLTLWFDADEDASVENLVYILEGLDLMEAVAVLKPEDEK